MQQTMCFSVQDEKRSNIDQVLRAVYLALRQKGYNPTTQLVGYILTEDPAYITSYQGARSMVARYDRHDYLQFLLEQYLFEEVRVYDGDLDKAR